MGSKAGRRGRRAWWWVRGIVLSALVVAVVWSGVGPVGAAEKGIAVAGGRMYSETAGNGSGFSVVDTADGAFWSTYQRLGGVDHLGYPISRRFAWQGGTAQFFQRGVLHWQPWRQEVVVANLFDAMHTAGLDDDLLERWGIPRVTWLPDEESLAWPELAAARVRLLDAEPRLRRYYDSFPDATERFGLPMSSVQDTGPFLMVRLQRATLQLWKSDGPDVRAGAITVANSGEIARTLGLIDPDALEAEPMPAKGTQPVARCSVTATQTVPAGRRVVALDPGHGGPEIGSVARYGDGTSLAEKTANLRVAQRAAALLREAGFGVVLTRERDAVVNASGCDVNGNGRVSLEDDLQSRVDIANAIGAAVFVSIHNNGHPSRAQRGTEVYYSARHPLAQRNRHLASLLQQNIVGQLRGAGHPTVDRGIRTDQSIGRTFFILSPTGRRVIRHSQMPAALGESLFLTNPTDAAALRRPEIIDAIARGYVQGIRAFLGE